MSEMTYDYNIPDNTSSDVGFIHDVCVTLEAIKLKLTNPNIDYTLKDLERALDNMVYVVRRRLPEDNDDW